jgi:hypothetical protein
MQKKKSEIFISGIATLKHNLATQRGRIEGKRARVYKIINFKLDTTNEKENPWGYRLGTVSGKTICHWGL